MSDLKLFAIHCLAAPLALCLALFQRYGDGIVIIPGAIPMVLIFGISYVGTSAYIALSKRRLLVNYRNRVITILLLVFAFDVFVLAIFRFHFSLGFVSIFVITCSLWMIIIETALGIQARTARYGIVKVGDWDSLVDAPMDLVFLERPEELPNLKSSGLIVDLNAELTGPWLKAISNLAVQNVQVIDITDVWEVLHNRVALSKFGGGQLPSVQALANYGQVKRILDLIVSTVAIVVLVIPILILIIIIRCETKGNGIYKQKRIGKNGREFYLYKLRTMYDNAEPAGPKFAKTDDPRVTRVGRVLRRFRIDEWPQFANVLLGEMSLVGPRPERPTWVWKFRQEIPNYDLRHIVPPGITGWAQIWLGYVGSKDTTITKLEYDLFYIKHMSPLFDLEILLRTMIFLVRRPG